MVPISKTTRNNCTGYYGASPNVFNNNTSVSHSDFFQPCGDLNRITVTPPNNAAGYFGTPPSTNGTTFNRIGVTPPNNTTGFFGTPPSGSSTTLPLAQQVDFNAFTQFQTLSTLLEEQNKKISELMDENKRLVSSFNVELNKVKEDFAMFKDISISHSNTKKSAKLPKSLMVYVTVC